VTRPGAGTTGSPGHAEGRRSWHHTGRQVPWPDSLPAPYRGSGERRRHRPGSQFGGRCLRSDSGQAIVAGLVCVLLLVVAVTPGRGAAAHCETTSTARQRHCLRPGAARTKRRPSPRLCGPLSACQP